MSTSPRRSPLFAPRLDEGCEAFRCAMERAFPLNASDDFDALLRSIDDGERQKPKREHWAENNGLGTAAAKNLANNVCDDGASVTPLTFRCLNWVDGGFMRCK